MGKLRLVAFVTALVLFPESAARAVPELTLDQVLHQARASNRTLQASRARLEQARTTLSLAWAALFPVVNAQGKYTRNNLQVSFPLTLGPGESPRTVTIQPANQFDGVISFLAPLIAPPAFVALKASKASVQAAQADHETSLHDVLYAVAQTFYMAAIADEVIAARQSSVAVARATAQLAETRYAVGAVTKTDVDRAQLALVRAEQAEREARFSREQSYRALGTLIQAQGEFTVRPATPHAPAIPPLATALSLRPEFRSLQLTATSLALQARASAWRWSPTLSAFGNLHVFNYDSFAQQRHTWALGVQLDWVLYDGGIRDAQRRQANAQARETRIRGEILSDSIRDDLANQQSQLDTKRHAQDAAERQVALAEEALGLVRTQYQAGSVAEIDLLRAQDDLTAAKEALAQAHLEVALADLALQRAAGTFPGNAGL